MTEQEEADFEKYLAENPLTKNPMNAALRGPESLPKKYLPRKRPSALVTAGQQPEVW